MTEPVPIQRALCLKHILSHKATAIQEGELLVGERGAAPKAVPTYPEICLHSMDDLTILDTRDKVPYRVSQEPRSIYEKEIIPFWQGKTIRERIFSSVGQDWLDAFEAGIFTEFQEQRSPGHTACESMIYTMGFLDLKKKIQETIEGLDYFHDPAAMDHKNQLTAMNIAADALVALIRSYFSMDGHHVQFNVVSLKTLEDAQKHSEKHRDLIVRVAGYSDYFVDLTIPLQKEIMRRTEHDAW